MNNRNTQQETQMTREMEADPVYGVVTADALSEELMTGEAQQQIEESEELAAQIREGIGMLFEDGWTSEELAALSQDEGVRADIAAGKDVIRAAAAYLRRQMQQMAGAQSMRRRSLPVSRYSAAGTAEPKSRIEQMTDAQFDAFSREARAAAMMGRKIRM